jgi:predicted amidohydrolase
VTDLRIAVAQPCTRAGDVAVNATAHADAVRRADARLVVFPELSLTGYEMTAAAIDDADPRLEPIVDACAASEAVALVGAPVAGDRRGTTSIGVLRVDANGVSVAYRKLWLSQEEARHFSPGAAPVVLELDGWRLGLAVCKDTGVAQHAADTAALGIDAYVAGTVMRPDETAELHERGRRIATTHGVWVAFARYAGPTGSGYDETAGASAVWDPSGARVGEAGTTPGESAVAVLTRMP